LIDLVDFDVGVSLKLDKKNYKINKEK